MEARSVPVYALPAVDAAPVTPAAGIADHSERIRAQDALQRRALAFADGLVAAFAFMLPVAIVGNDHLRLMSLAIIPVVILGAKLIGLYDRDELLIHKTTADEIPAIFQLATGATLVGWLLDRTLVDGSLSHNQVLLLWFLLTVGTIGARWVVRRIAERVAEPERCLIIGGEQAR